ncbi:hypothetical protein DXG01_008901, partial [Tephrocybe rancida]
TISLLSTSLDISCHSSEIDKATAYTQIANDIELLQSTILKLRSRHNSLSLVARLPPEILGKVFISLASIYKERSPKNPWIKVSFVCAYWRQTALDCPELWSTVLRHGDGSQYVSTMLSRSRDHPLSVEFSYSDLAPDAMAHILKQLHRVQYLDLTHNCDGGTCDAVPIISQLTAPAPLLKSFSVGCFGAKAVQYLPDHLFASTTLQIRSMHLNAWMISADVSPFDGLERLVLSNLGEQGGPRLNEIFSLARKAPNLKDLVLRGRLPYQDGPHNPLDILHLPCLELLEVGYCTPPLLYTLYSHIHHPRTTRVRLAPKAAYYSNNDESLYALGTYVSTSTTVRHALIKSHKPDFELSFSELEDGSTLTTSSTITLALEDINYNDAKVLPFFKGLQLMNLTSLSVEGLTLDKVVWHALFGQLEYLEMLRIHGKLRDLLWALTDTFHDDGSAAMDARSGAMGFRALRTLVLDRWDLDPGWVGFLEARLEARSAQGVGLQTLRLVGGSLVGISAERAETWLQPYVGEVEMEGVEFGDADLDDMDLDDLSGCSEISSDIDGDAGTDMDVSGHEEEGSDTMRLFDEGMDTNDVDDNEYQGPDIPSVARPVHEINSIEAVERRMQMGLIRGYNGKLATSSPAFYKYRRF